MANARTSTPDAPARFRARAQARAVAPVVMTSSMSTILAPASSSAYLGDGKSAGNVVSALLAAESDLRLRAFGALQRERLVAQPGQPRDLLRQDRRLVEATSGQPSARQRHRDDDVGVGEQLAAGLGQPSRRTGVARRGGRET